ncbi:hypothetical protein [Achromobacter piechaudii]|uniref:hypothetical protein n=1 Tax=Achromobacter piechaudii TaxID=72556 RepID=UPI0014687888|nr:hypothetical protein [Achromobacter piechaudii]CAB3959608.1 hypothetical protein LMG6103_05854 [Achromobacter piechaudii]
MSIDFLLCRVYDRKTYNCLHFAADAWEHLTGDRRLREVKEDELAAGRLSALFRSMHKITGPSVLPSIALMETLQGEAHIAVCVRGRLLHINESGASFFPVEAQTALYRNMRFYA